MRVLGEFVLVEQIATPKKSGIILPGKINDSEKFDYNFKLVEIGPAVPEHFKNVAKIGDFPVFGQYVNFSGLKVLEKTKKIIRTLVVVHYNDIIAIDNEEDNLTENFKDNSEEELLP